MSAWMVGKVEAPANANMMELNAKDEQCNGVCHILGQPLPKSKGDEGAGLFTSNKVSFVMLLKS